MRGYLPALLASTAILWLGQARADDRPLVDVAIVFVADTSNSISTSERYLERRSHADALASEPVQSAIADTATGAIATAYVEFGSQAWVRVGWTRIDGIEPAKAFGAAVLKADFTMNGETAVGAGLEVADGLIASLPYKAQRVVVDVIGNGDSNFGDPVGPARAALLARGAIINGMPMIRDAADADLVPYYAAQITGGPGHFNMPLTVIGDMPEALRRKILLELY